MLSFDFAIIRVEVVTVATPYNIQPVIRRRGAGNMRSVIYREAIEGIPMLTSRPSGSGIVNLGLKREESEIGGRHFAEISQLTGSP
jgi:hypothetical protein